MVFDYSLLNKYLTGKAAGKEKDARVEGTGE